MSLEPLGRGRTFERPGLQKMLVSKVYIVFTVTTEEDPYALVNQRHQDNMAEHMAPEDIYPQKMKFPWMFWKISITKKELGYRREKTPQKMKQSDMAIILEG